MTAESETAEARASREATDWFILLREEPEDADLRARFDAWLLADPRNGAAWTVTRRTTTIMARVPPVGGGAWLAPATSNPGKGEGAGLRADLSAAARSGRPARGRRLAAASVVALAACLGLLFMPGLILRLEADHVTGTGEIRSVRLDDGSTLVLAPESAVEVAYSVGERRINLLAGEAFFTVQPDPARAFRVFAKGIETTDLGTAFGVRRTEVGSTIVVESGSVRVDYKATSPSVSEHLEAGQSISVSWAGSAVRGEQVSTQIAPWRERRLIAQDEPMQDVIDALRPYFGGRIVLADASLASRRVTGVYNLTDPANALRGIAQARGASVRQISPWLLIVSAE